MSEQLLIDTDILIDYLREADEAVEYLEGLETKAKISVLTIAELYTGAREKEMTAVENLIGSFDIIHIDERTAKEAGLMRKKYLKSHSIGLADALIAATAKLNNCTLISLNLKHFPMIENKIAPYRKRQ